MPRLAPLLLAALALAAPASAWAQAPAGFRTCENRESGFRFFCPNRYQGIPTQPGEPIILGRFLGPVYEVERRKTSYRSQVEREILILRIQKPARPVTGKSEPQPKAGTPEEEEEKNKPRTAKEALQRELEASSFQEFLTKRLKPWEIGERSKDKDRKRSWSEIELKRKAAKGVAPGRGRVWIFDQKTWLLALVATGPEATFDKDLRNLKKCALSLQPIEARSKERETLERFYRRRPQFKSPAFRIDRQMSLVRGWKAIDTPNYLILHHSKDTRLLAKIENDIEAMRKLYEELFPAAAPIGSVSVVRVCKDRSEYMDYGGKPRTAGYWNSVREELVLYDNVGGKQGSRLGNKDSLIVLYHEAFHQYIHYAAGALPPHSWFNEGYGDYFSGAIVYHRSKNVKEVGPNPWRKPVIQRAIKDGKHIPLEKLIQAEQKEYYKAKTVGIYYAQGWSLIYFLKTCPEAQKREDWQAILPTYFEFLKAIYKDNLAQLDEDATLEKKEEAGKGAREVAVEQAFKDIDVAELEQAWKRYTASLH